MRELFLAGVLAAAACEPANGPADAAASLDAAASRDAAGATDGAASSDLSGLEGGSADLSGGGDAGFFGPPRCATAGVQLCDGFETGVLDPALWTLSMSAGSTVAIDTVRAARGSHSLHIHTGSNGGSIGMISETKTFPAANNTFFGRAFVYLATTAPMAHVTIVEATGQGTLMRYGAQFQRLLANDQTPTIEYAQNSQTKMPIDRWACFEWQYKGDSNEMHFWLDSTEITDLAILPNRSPAWTAPSYGQLNLGWHVYGSDPAPGFDLWLDEVAVDGARIGCSR